VQTGSGPAHGEFLEDLLFTHRGLSGPAILQISSFWRPGRRSAWTSRRHATWRPTWRRPSFASRRQLGNELAEMLPRRLADTWLAERPGLGLRPMPELRDRDLQQLAAGLARWELTPSGTEGYRKAEVTAGGVDTRALSSQTMESRQVPGLYSSGKWST
jgi:predicted flavoprotein YhiN